LHLSYFILNLFIQLKEMFLQLHLNLSPKLNFRAYNY